MDLAMIAVAVGVALQDRGQRAGLQVESPLAEGRFVCGEAVVFRAHAAGRRAKKPVSVKWTSDKDGELGSGEEVTASGLSVGTHRIAGVAEQGTAEVTVRVFSDLGDLYRTPPSEAELRRVLGDFEIEFDGDGWTEDDWTGLTQECSKPSKALALARLDLLRHQRFDKALPIAPRGKRLYDHFRSHVRKIRFRADLKVSHAKGEEVSLNRNFSTAWKGESYVSALYLLIHEGRHTEPGDPGHTTLQKNPIPDGQDAELEKGSGYAWAALYLMWVYKYGTSDPADVKNEARDAAAMFLKERIGNTDHSNPNVREIVRELLR